jgi:type IV secretory pathway TrbL component
MKARFQAGATGASAASYAGGGQSSAAASGSASGAPGWARRMKREQSMNRGAEGAAHAVRSGDHGGGGASVDLSEGEG